MNKIKIMPQVTVYKDMLSEEQIDFLMNQITESQKEIKDIETTPPETSAYFDLHGPQPEDRQDQTLIYTWTPWYTFGLRSIWSDPRDTRNKKEHVEGFNLIKNTIAAVHEDYVNDYKDSGRWTYDISNWDILAPENEDHSNMPLSTFEILQHRINTEEEYTIGVHTDWHDHRKDEPGPKQIFTYTIYLTDDYEGGEIDFVDEAEKHIIVYKPKKGDVTVFPAGKPFWHGARAVKSEPSKVFIRTFSIYRHPGSKEWNMGVKVNGATKWMGMQNEIYKKYIDDGNVGRQIVYPGNVPQEDANLVPLYVTKETYIDGRTI